jgi:hypothetical protein
MEQKYLYPVVVFLLHEYIKRTKFLYFFFKMQRGSLILEDGSEFQGFVFGSATNTSGEVGKTLLINLYTYLFLLLFSLSNWYGRLY